MSAEWAAHVIQSGMTTVDENGEEIPVPFIGPKKSVELWQKWGVPADRCITVKPGDAIKIKDLEIIALDSFDRTCIVTTDKTDETREELTGVCPTDMDDKAVNYLIKTPGGNIYHSGDSHFSIYFAKHGKDYDVDVAFGSFGENPIGMQDKMTSIDVLRMAENLQCKVVVPIHWMYGQISRLTAMRLKFFMISRKIEMNTNSIHSSGRWAESIHIRQIRIRFIITTEEDSRIALKHHRISHIVPVCKSFFIA